MEGYELKRILLLTLLLFLIVIGGCHEKESPKAISKVNKNVETSYKWEKSNVFESNGYEMLGKKDKIGIIYSKESIFEVNKPKKYMWHFWGKEDEFSGELKVIATHEQEKQEIILLEGRPLAGSNNGATQHVPSNFSLPKKGMWKLDAYIGDKLFGSIIVEVI